MRQAGILATAGLIALEQMPERLPLDHANAKLLAQGLASIDGITADAAKVQTNIVVIDVSGVGMSPAEISSLAKQRGLLFNAIGPRQMRLVTHFDVSRADCETALDIIAGIVKVPARK